MGLGIYKYSLVLILIFSCKTKLNSQDLVLEKSFNIFQTLKDNSHLNFKQIRNAKNPYGKSKQNEDEYIYVYQSDQKANNEFVEFEISKINNKLSVLRFQKFFHTKYHLHFLRKHTDLDTLYYYKMVKLGDDSKNFVLGKYAYYHERLNFFSDKEFDFYLKHKDSLSKVRGNIKLFKGM